MMAQTLKKRENKLFFELYTGNKFERAFYGTEETLDTYLNIFAIDRYVKMGNIVAIHFKENN